MSDRAAVVATAIIQIFTTALRRWLAGDASTLANVRAEIASVLHDEFADVARMTRDEIRIDD
jgi:hypothetical protein